MKSILDVPTTIALVYNLETQNYTAAKREKNSKQDILERLGY